jgi:hypothetical protein
MDPEAENVDYRLLGIGFHPPTMSLFAIQESLDSETLASAVSRGCRGPTVEILVCHRQTVFTCASHHPPNRPLFVPNDGRIGLAWALPGIVFYTAVFTNSVKFGVFDATPYSNFPVFYRGVIDRSLVCRHLEHNAVLLEAQFAHDPNTQRHSREAPDVWPKSVDCSLYSGCWPLSGFPFVIATLPCTYTVLLLGFADGR